MKIKYFLTPFCLIVFTGALFAQKIKSPISISGIYPSLAYFNNEGECGTGAVVPWANRLWVITYGPHMPFGSSDKLYEITASLQKITRPESIGGTPANRMIHKESSQLFIGPYAIDTNRNVRVIPISKAPGRFTGTARSLTDPANKVIIGTMEEGFYDVDVHSLDVKTLYKDGNQLKREGAKSYESGLLIGVHGKGTYSGQGVVVFSNNGEEGEKARIDPRIEAGSLSEWDGKNWKLIRRNQFTEVTGPGGIYGNDSPNSQPIWSTGWDYKSVLLGLRDKGNWTFYRLPKASNSYDGAHGWNTEWPRIRNIGTDKIPDYLMTMHGMFWKFPQTFTASNTSGIRPRSSYLKVIGDFTRWKNELVFGCDDAAKSEFLNKRQAKGGIAGPGQSQSNLWFTSLTQPDQTGTTDASGSVWLSESIQPGSVSDPFLFAGWNNRIAWVKNDGTQDLNFSFEVDKKGNNQWSKIQTLKLAPNSSTWIAFDPTEQAEWIRVKTDNATKATISFVYSSNKPRLLTPNKMFNGLATVSSTKNQGGLLYSVGNNRGVLGILANVENGNRKTVTGYYEMDEQMKIVPVSNDSITHFIRDKVAIPSQVVTVDASSYVIVDDAKRRWRLPLGNESYQELMAKQQLRICREVATERDLFNCGGTFYELPAENADGYAKIRPISSHQFKINDYTSFRGMLVMTGLTQNSAGLSNPHIFQSADKQCSVWAGVIDDLWQLGKPVGKGGPWLNSTVIANTPSDPYLYGCYDDRTLSLSHQSNKSVTISIQFDPTGDNEWVNYKSFVVKANEKFSFKFPNNIQARWIRFVTDTNTIATAWLDYK
jgi:hypothetical protein